VIAAPDLQRFKIVGLVLIALAVQLFPDVERIGC
jgi:hypothetical protein